MPKLSLVLLLLALLGTSCVSGSSSTPSSTSTSQPSATQSTKRIVLAMMGEPSGFIARMNTTQISIPGVSDLEQLVNASLCEQVADKTYQPLLAEAVPTIENGLWKLLPDGRMETTWRIRNGALWHDGTPF